LHGRPLTCVLKKRVRHDEVDGDLRRNPSLALSRNLNGIVEAQVDVVAAHPHVILSVAKDPGF
jgi:hypothetical protein